MNIPLLSSVVPGGEIETPVLHEFGRHLFLVVESMPLVGTLFTLVCLDVLTGVAASAIKRQVSSSASFRGMTGKSFMFLLVGLGAIMEPFAQGIPVARLIALYYCATEGISIIENAALIGVPLPRFLTDVLLKIRESADAGGSPKGTVISATVPPQTELRVTSVAADSGPRQVEVVNTPENPIPTICENPLNNP